MWCEPILGYITGFNSKSVQDTSNAMYLQSTYPLGVSHCPTAVRINVLCNTDVCHSSPIGKKTAS